MDLPAPAAGVLGKILVPAGAMANVGDVVGRIEPQARPAGTPAPALKSAALAPAAAKAAPPAATPAPAATSTSAAAKTAPPASEPRVMPAARRALAEHQLTPAEVTPTGPGGRLLKEDVERRAADVAATPSTAPARPPGGDGGAAAPTAALGPVGAAGRQTDVVPMTMLRRRIAERLVESQRNTAALTTFNEIDVSALQALRREVSEAFEKKFGIKLGLMSFFVKAAVDALRRVPEVNAEIRGTDIVYHNYYDVGVAVSTERGLVVPVVRNAERLSFAELEQTIADLATRARTRKLTLEELQGGTFTISNGGVFGSLLSTPILNPPQSGILGMHTIQERPVAVGGQVVIRPMMYVALTYDHRLIDGAGAVMFLKRVKDCIEAPPRMLVEI
jgi:2-oxoglutarate dehydrogenase E2 component (dihydrolipoamide succinyltransferase)